MIYINTQLFIPLLLRKEKHFWYGISILLSIVLLIIVSGFFNWLATNNSPTYTNGILFTYFFTGLRIVFLSYLLYIAMEWIDQKFLLQEIEIEKLHAEKQYLKNQLNPHFLFNTLNNLHGLMLTNKDSAAEALLRFSDFLQYIVYTSEEKCISLSKEIQLVQDYLLLEKLRISKDKTIEYIVPASDSKYLIAPLILLPLVENAVKHGIHSSGKNAFLKMSITVNDNQLDLFISNSKGKGNAAKGKGIGLKNLKRRLELEYPHQHSLSFQEEEDTYTTHLQLTLDAV
jgi:two-component system LytT family sensor kinase